MGKKTNLLTANLMAFSFLLISATPPAFAEGDVYRLRSKANGSTGRVSGQSDVGSVGQVTHATTQVEKVDVVVTNSATVESCSADQGKAEYFPLEFFKMISINNTAPEIELRSGNRIAVKLPPVLNSCGNFSPEFVQDSKTLDVTIMIKAEKDGKKVTYAEFLKCLEDQKLVGQDGYIKHGEIPGNKYSYSVHEGKIKFDPTRDAAKTVKVSFGFPYAFKSFNDSGYEPLHGFISETPAAGMSCMLQEKVAEKPVFFNKGKDVLLQEWIQTCEHGTSGQIKELLSAVGSYEAVKDDLQVITAGLIEGYMGAAKKEADKILKDMDKLETKISEGGDKLEEKEARKLVAKYAELAKKLNETYLDPAITQLDDLMKQREALEEASLDSDEVDPRIAEIDKKIKALNESISAFANKNPSQMASLYAVMQKFAINDSAKTIEDIRLKSYFYGKVNPGIEGKKKMSMESAAKEQSSRLKKFDASLKEWTDYYMVSKGNTEPLKRVEKQRAAMIQSMNKRYANFEQTMTKDYNLYCAVGMLGTVKNPTKCQQFMSNYNTRLGQELQKRERDLKNIATANTKLERMGMNYNEYQLEMQKRMRDGDMSGGYESFGYGDGEYEDYSSALYPEYSGPSMATDYLGMNQYNTGANGRNGVYNFGGGNAIPAMQNGGMPSNFGSQQLMQPSMMQPYQQQQGGWPRI